MSSPDSVTARATLESLRSYLRETTLDVVWRQWHALGGMTSSNRRTNSLVDPEALILISLTLARVEHRLGDILGDWAAVNSDLISVQRTRNLARHFPDTTSSALASFAQIAYEEGKDHRWKSLLDNRVQPLERRTKNRSAKKRATRARPLEPAALVLRLRLAFGVSIKADMLAFLLTTESEPWASVGVIAAATNYTVAAVRKAAQNLVEARFVEQMADTRSEFHVNHKGWRELLEIRALPSWRGWAERFSFVAAFLAWAEVTEDRAFSSYLLESRGLALLRTHERAFRWHGVTRDAIRPKEPGDRDQLSGAIHALGDWMTRVS